MQSSMKKQVVDVSFLQPLEEIKEVAQHTPHELVMNRVREQIVAIAVPQIKAASMQNRTEEQLVNGPVQEIVTSVQHVSQKLVICRARADRGYPCR